MLLLAKASDAHEAGCLEERKLALNGPRTGACETDHLVCIEAPPRVAEEDPEDALLDLGEQCVGQACRSTARVARGPFHSHFGYDKPLSGYGQRLGAVSLEVAPTGTAGREPRTASRGHVASAGERLSRPSEPEAWRRRQWPDPCSHFAPVTPVTPETGRNGSKNEASTRNVELRAATCFSREIRGLLVMAVLYS